MDDETREEIRQLWIAIKEILETLKQIDPLV